MIIDRITIANLFSYFGEQVFDLTGSTSSRNIVLIYGRNGHGKTSFINSLKLLFCGSDNLSMRRVGLAQGTNEITLSSKAFISGQPPIWEGIRNLQAVRHQFNDYFVKIEWQENNKRIIAIRSWPLSSNNQAGELEITEDGIVKENPSVFLENRLPKDLVPYFYFDGERIRELAEASEGQLITYHIERLLDLRRIVDLRDQCMQVLTELRRQYADAHIIQRQLELEENRFSQLAEVNKFRSKFEELQSDLQSVDIRLEEIRHNLDRIFEAGSRFDEEAIKRQQEDINDRLEIACNRFVEIASFDAPLSVNQDLAKKVIARLSEIIRKEGFEQHQLILRLGRILPEELFGLPPHSSPRLTSSQERFYIDKLKNTFEKMTSGILECKNWKISPDKIQELYERFSNSLSLAEGRKHQAAEVLKQISRERRDQSRLEKELLEVGGLSSRDKELYDKLKAEQRELDDRKVNIKSNINECIGNIEKKDKVVQDIEQQLRKIAIDIERASEGKKKVELLQKSIQALDAYRKSTRERRRVKIQEKMNSYFLDLMDSSSHIASVKLDQSFIPGYYDSDKREIGRFSISAGTKQLIATALLWALKDISQRPVPIVVDTPLARIDRRHQENLLTKFYPFVSEQVIILPTDSELDLTKYNILKNHIYKEYRLDNPTGVSTVPSLTPMHPKS